MTSKSCKESCIADKKCKWRETIRIQWYNGCEEQYYYDNETVTFNVNGIFKGKEITNIVLTELEENPDSFDMKIDATNMQCINKTIMFKSLTSTNSHEIMIDRYLKGCF